MSVSAQNDSVWVERDSNRNVYPPGLILRNTGPGSVKVNSVRLHARFGFVQDASTTVFRPNVYRFGVQQADPGWSNELTPWSVEWKSVPSESKWETWEATNPFSVAEGKVVVIRLGVAYVGLPPIAQPSRLSDIDAWIDQGVILRLSVAVSTDHQLLEQPFEFPFRFRSERKRAPRGTAPPD